MKKSIIILALVLAAGIVHAQSKIALIVAIGKYENNSGWSAISSENDIPLIKAALIKQGFEDKDIMILKDAEATRDGILNAIKTHLIEKSSLNGVAVFHYSGHGQQIMDDNGDEFDGYDEAIVPYNAKARYMPGVYTGENHIRDEELGKNMDLLRLKLGSKGNVLVVLDACHSGTGTRGPEEVAKHRGTKEVFAPEGFVPNARGTKSDNNSIGTDPKGTDKMASMVGFFGASPQELNYETEDEKGLGVGSLSYAFSRVFSNADKNSTYRGLFDKIKVEMSSFAPKQTPQAEGQLDYGILGGKISGKQDYYKVEKWKGDKNMVINGGEIMGIFANTKVAFYDNNTKDISKAKPKATGIVTSTTLISAEITLDNPLNKETAMGSWIFVTEKNYGSMEVKIKLDVKNKSLIEALQNEFVKYPFIKSVNSGQDIIVDEGNKYTRGAQQVTLTSLNDYLLLDEVVNTNNMAITASSIVEAIREYSQAKYIRSMEITDPKMDVKFEFIPIEVVEDGGRMKEKSRGDIKTKIDEAGTLSFKSGETCKIKITNNGTKMVYFTIIDIQPDNKINLIVPNEEAGRKAEDYQIKPGESKELSEFEIIQFYPPFGNEVYKIIATENPLDLSSIIATRGESTRGEKDANPFSVLFSESFKSNGTRGTKMPNVPTGSANIYTLPFKIVE